MRTQSQLLIVITTQQKQLSKNCFAALHTQAAADHTKAAVQQLLALQVICTLTQLLTTQKQLSRIALQVFICIDLTSTHFLPILLISIIIPDAKTAYNTAKYAYKKCQILPIIMPKTSYTYSKNCLQYAKYCL